MATNIFIISVAYIAGVILASNAVDGAIGINWGRQSAQRLVPSQVVDLLLQNGVKHARIYNAQEDVLQAFAGSGIGLIVTIFFAPKITSMDVAGAWVQRKSLYFSSSSVRYVIVGDYTFDRGIIDKPYLISSMNALQYVQNALNKAGYGDQIKAIGLHLFSELKPLIKKPSEAEFRDAIKEEIGITLSFLQQNNAPFAIEMFPFVDISNITGADHSFVFADNKSTTVIKDINGAVYNNIFEFVHDSFVWALKKAGAPDIKIMVSQVGWPTDGAKGANVSAAEYFHKCLLPLVASNKGTPMRPNQPIETFVHSLADEGKNEAVFPFSRHWGIYRSNGQPKYKIDLSGQGRDIYPTSIKGIMRMPARWCVFNGNMTDYANVKAQFNYACQKADCTSLAPGGTCGELSVAQNVSYAFNIYFQYQFQDEQVCDFDGLGYVSVDDPSTGECVFPVEVVKGQQNNFVANPVGKGFHGTPNCAAILVFLLSIMATLFWN